MNSATVTSGLPVLLWPGKRVQPTRWLAWILPAASLLLAGCAEGENVRGAPSIIHPRGLAAGRIDDLWWIMFWLGSAVFLIVMGALLVALFHRRREPVDEQATAERGKKAILWGGIILPAIILLVVFGFTVGTLRAMSMPETDENTIIEVIGHRWWWEVHYTDHQFFTANEIHIPVGQPVQIKLTSQDVIHSFWVPQLHGKMDMNPGKTNTFWIRADEAGEYWGECAEFCGVQHAKMQFVVVAELPEEFEAWLEQQRQPAAEPVDELAQQGKQIFLSSDCINCHTIEGTNATGALGPDLTHLASRRTLGAGAIENTIGSLGGWVVDSHSIKPGNLMPETDIDGPELHALLAYLVSLK